MDDRAGRDRVPAGVFFKEARSEEPRVTSFGDDEDADVGFAHVAPPTSVPSHEFFRAPPPPPGRTLARWAEDPFRHGGVLVVIGLTGTLVLASNVLTQIVIGAPVFEELWKFGLALLLVAALGVTSGPARLLVALVPGASFGAFEHFLTYPSEPTLVFANRIVFHSGATTLSMAVYHALEPVWDARVRWASTIPSTVVHWANNFAAVLLAVASIAVGDRAGTAALAVTVSIAVGSHLLAWGTLLAERRLRGLALRLWVRHAPADLKSRPRS